MAGIYFHFPFCRQACHYCNFHFSTQLKHQQTMPKAFEKEISLRNDEIPQRLESIYFGGGSPSLLSTRAIENLLNIVMRDSLHNDKIEITIEVNPDDVSDAYLNQLKSIGVNRISIGIQSFFDHELRMMNRIHSAAQAINAIERTAHYFDNFSIDLIYGVPGSNLTTWKNNLNRALSFDPPHLSSYALTVEPKTVLAHQVKTKQLDLLDEEWVKSQYDWMVDRMEEAGLENYEFSNYSKPGFQSINNSNYWEGKAYIGIGPAAHSFDGYRKRSWNIANNQKYMKSLEQGILPSQHENLKEHEAFNEYIMTGLRTAKGVSLEKVDQSFGNHYVTYLEQQVENHLIHQRLYWDGDALKVSKGAKFLSDGIASDLFILKD